MMKDIMMLAMSAAMLIACGCKTEEESNEIAEVTCSNVVAVVVGVENGWAGSCPGALKDTQSFKSIMSEITPNITVLADKAATVEAVKSTLSKHAAQAEHLVFFYSGHGGQRHFSDTHDEADGQDEFLCLYDTYMRDDDVWSIISQAKGRVTCVFDCCHSATMFKAPAKFSFSSYAKKSSNMMRAGDKQVSILVWSGCPDDTYSYGSSLGGMLTNTLKKNWKNGITYRELWSKIKADKELASMEDSQETVIGEDFRDREAFK